VDAMVMLNRVRLAIPAYTCSQTICRCQVNQISVGAQFQEGGQVNIQSAQQLTPNFVVHTVIEAAVGQSGNAMGRK
jgi:hypothetical protein